MWIDSRYYEKLAETLEGFSTGDFNFDEQYFNKYTNEKYQRLTTALANIKETSDTNVKNCLTMLKNIVEGNCEEMPTTITKSCDYQAVYQQYNDLVAELNTITQRIQQLKNIITNGELNSKIELEGLSGIWLESTQNINAIIVYFVENKDNFIRVLNKVAQGDLTYKVTAEAKGEMLELKMTVNTLVEQLAQFSSEITRIVKELGTDGRLGGQAKVDNVSGTWLDLTNNVNDMANTLTYQVRDISEVTTAIAEGDLNHKITVDAKGEMLELKNTINTTVEQLSQFASEVTRVAKEVGTEGILGGQAKVDNVLGTWLDLTNNVNDMANSLTYQVRNISEVTTAIAEGDLTQKITVEAAGEVEELKSTINIMVDQLSQFASEITKVAKEVGTDGKFGVKAEVEDVSGIWLDLTNNVNIMSESLAEADKKNKNQRWIKDGISILSKEILHKDMISEQFQIAITQICRYMKASMGAIYIYDSASNQLELEASYAYQKSDGMLTSFHLGEGIIGQTAYDRQAILMEGSQSNQVIQAGTTNYPIASTYTAPLIFKGNLVGVIEVATHCSFSELQIEYLDNTLSVLSGSFYAAILQTKDHRQLELLSNTDALTGLYNRGFFDKILPEILDFTKRTDGIICFAMADIDFFKDFNDQYGHKIGDEVLKSVAGVLKAKLKRDNDYCFRIGGEEFAIIFSANDPKKAFQFIDNIRKTIEQLEITDEKIKNIHNITISMGLTFKRALDINNAEELFEETDRLLYLAKESGRNRVIQNN